VSTAKLVLNYAPRNAFIWKPNKHFPPLKEQVKDQVIKMHESHLIQGAIRKICDEAAKKNIKHIRSINLKVGKGHGMDEESVRLHFEALAEGTPVEGAAIVVNFIPVKLKCPSCGNLFERPKRSLECPQCHTLSVATDIGREFIVESIEAK
jgi:hydrogenase nickel incorporation protein HypA/HybF